MHAFNSRRRLQTPIWTGEAPRRECRLDRKESGWCCQTGLNCRPLHYQWSALPLSYGSMRQTQESAKKASARRPILATRPKPAQAPEGPAQAHGRPLYQRQAAAAASASSIAARSGRIYWRSHKGERTRYGWRAAARANSDRRYGKGVSDCVRRAASGALEQVHDEEQQRQARRSNRSRGEKSSATFKAGSAQTGASRKSQATEIAGERTKRNGGRVSRGGRRVTPR